MKFNLDVVPGNLNDAVDLLIKSLNDKDINYIKKHESSDVHFSLGMYLRNAWSMWDESTILMNWFKTNLGISHPDDASGLILKKLWATVLDKHFDLETEVKYYKDYWDKINTGE